MTNIYFHHGGFYAMPYYIGAIQQLQKEYNKPNSKLKRKKIKYYGNSAGGAFALVCYLVLNGYLDIEQHRQNFEEQYDKKRPISPILTPFYIDLINLMVDYWPNNLAQLITGVFHIGVSTRTGYKFISKFENNYEIYNALMCSGTIPGCSNYESKINGQVCLDGAYLFNNEHIPKNAIIIASDVDAPLCLTVPPKIIRPLLQEKGVMTVKQYFSQGIRQKDIIILNSTPLRMTFYFWLHEKMEKGVWEEEIRKKTG
jgi:hypothetical protein